MAPGPGQRGSVLLTYYTSGETQGGVRDGDSVRGVRTSSNVGPCGYNSPGLSVDTELSVRSIHRFCCYPKSEACLVAKATVHK